MKTVYQPVGTAAAETWKERSGEGNVGWVRENKKSLRLNIFSEGKSKVGKEQRTEVLSLWKARIQDGEEKEAQERWRDIKVGNSSFMPRRQEVIDIGKGYISSLLKAIEAGWELPFPGGWTEVIFHGNMNTAQ